MSDISALSAPDLTKRPPRSPRSRLGNLVILPRMLDKGRAAIANTPGEYHYNCPVDQHLTRYLGLDADALREQLAAGLGDGEILTWIMANAKQPRQPWEIAQWSTYMDTRTPDSDAETLGFFTEAVGKLSTTREDVKTWFDMLELDDHVTFGGKA